ncbi:MAG TPA: deoxyribonuclease IV, partial [Actinobacteria bacterium]|nr:deoxyribonuclease IV [Actinomycetes bacterium]HEX21352.1 deoxyribonuclease IV [Actinomycetota bacterium]
MRLGSHVSIAGRLYLSVARAAAIGCQTMQIFSGNPRSWLSVKYDSADIAEFKKRRQAAGISPVTIHLPYLVNISSPDDEIRRKSVKAVLADLDIAKRIGADYLVVHAGSHRGAGRDVGLKSIAESLKEILTAPFGSVSLLLENTSGAGNAMGAGMLELGKIFNYFNHEERLGLCLDTCHAYGAGYDLATEAGLNNLFADIDSNFSFSRVHFLH